jgi:hypothetical protein
VNAAAQSAGFAGLPGPISGEGQEELSGEEDEYGGEPEDAGRFPEPVWEIEYLSDNEQGDHGEEQPREDSAAHSGHLAFENTAFGACIEVYVDGATSAE